MPLSGIVFPKDDAGYTFEKSRFPSLSYNTVLGSNGTYTQPWIDSTQTGFVWTGRTDFLQGTAGPQDINFVSGSVKSDQAGTVYVEQSDDQVNIQSTPYAVSAATLTPIPLTQITARYYRFRYVNGATAQTTFTLSQISERIDAFSSMQLVPPSTLLGNGASAPQLQQMSSNGSTYDLVQNNTQGTLLASAARTGPTQLANQINYNAKGIILTVNVTAFAGTSPSLTFQLQIIDPVTGLTFPLAPASTAITGNGQYIYIFYPTPITTPPGTVGTFQGPLPRLWSAYFNITGTTPSFTYSVGVSYIL